MKESHTTFNSFDVIKVTSIEEISSIKQKWKHLVDNFEETNVYIDPDYFAISFSSRAKDAIPYILLFQKNKIPKAILIGWTKDQKVPCSLGYLKFETPILKSLEIEIGGIINDNTDESTEIIKSYLNNIIKEGDIELLLVDHISQANPIWNSLVEGLGLNSKAIYKESVAWVSKIYDKQTDSANEIHSSKTRAKFRRKSRRMLEKFDNQLELRTLSSQDDLVFFIKNADIIGQKSYQYAIDVGIKDNKTWRDTLSSLIEGNYFRSYLLMNNERPIAYSYGIIYKDYFYQFATSYDPEYRKYSPGEYLRLEFTKKLVDEKIGFIDYGYGDAEYKRMFGTHSTEEATLKIYGKGLRPKFSRLLDKTSIAIHETLLGVLEKTGLLNKIKKFWRSRLANK